MSDVSSRIPAPSDDATALIPPHGGRLVERWAAPPEAAAFEASEPESPGVILDRRQRSDLELLASGGFSPLTGFMGREDLESVLHRFRLASGVVWTLPIVLAVDGAAARRLTVGDRVLLKDSEGRPIGALNLESKHRHDREEYARCVFGTADPAHPGVRRAREQGEWLLGGPVLVARRPTPVEVPRYHLDPLQTRAWIRGRRGRTLVAFQTRKTIHRANEFMLKSALEIFDGLLIQPLIGESRSDDIPASIRLRCYEVLLEKYFSAERALLAVLPAFMRFAGPREAVFHALVRKNFGCTHFIVGRDHAGVGGFYGPRDAQRFFDAFPPEDLGIVPLRYENAFYCKICLGMASAKTCPHPADQHLTLSGTTVREMLARRERPPLEFTRPEVAQILFESFADACLREVRR